MRKFTLSAGAQGLTQADRRQKRLKKGNTARAGRKRGRRSPRHTGYRTW